MLNSSFDVDILVNGKPVRKYSHNGRIFIEAREGIQYTIRAKNQGFYRQLLNCSVDGLSVLDGKLAGDTNNGYIINGLSNIEIKGFRTSDDTVNAFKFAKKSSGKTYAEKSEEYNGDTSNCGIIAFKFYNEKQKPAPTVIREDHHHYHNNWWCNNPQYVQPSFGNPQYTITCSDSSDGHVVSDFASHSKVEREYHETDRSSRSSLNNHLGGIRGAMNASINFCSVAAPAAPKNFDMGTEFSNVEINDKVKEVEFEVGELSCGFDIYYASREALLSWGVPLDKDTQISFPNGFPSKVYCKPPRR